MRILITGGAGFVGSNLVAHLAARGGHDIVVLDNESLGSRTTLAGLPHRFIPGDILDRDCLGRAMEGAEVIVHLAADTRVMDSIADPVHNYRNNVEGTFGLLLLARERKIPRIVVASTGGAILGDATPPIHEDMVARPLAPYGASKLAAEGYCSAFSAAYGMSIAALRFSNIYGPGSFHKGSVVAHFFKRLIHGEELVVYGDGSQRRDFLFVSDLMHGIERAMASRASGAFQMGSGRATSVNELLDAMRAVLGPKFASGVRYEGFRPGEVRDTWCNIDKARRELAFDPVTPLDEGLRRTWTWFEGEHARRAGK
jgi:UDP-glucose 4-epimerase